MNKLYLVTAYIFNSGLFIIGFFGLNEEIDKGLIDILPFFVAILLILVPFTSFFILPKIYKVSRLLKIEDVMVLDCELEVRKPRKLYKLLAILNLLFGLLLFILSLFGIYNNWDEYLNLISSFIISDAIILIVPVILVFSLIRVWFHFDFFRRLA